ncbi:hypothetical protein FACS189444_0270 [Spirochaetia bacterium]|nr:hypothetical protein FACS189444_0270 [Spirochaetia bacterium]
MKKNILVVMIGMVLVFGLVLTGCPKSSPDEYTVTFDADGGIVSPTSKKVVSGDAAGTLPTPTKSEKIFGGWYTAQNGGGTAFTPTDPVTANITVYAKWNNDILDGTTWAQIKNWDQGQAILKYVFNSPNFILSVNELWTGGRSSTRREGSYTVSGNTVTLNISPQLETMPGTISGNTLNFQEKEIGGDYTKE